MSYNHGKEERRWKRWKLAEEKVLRACSMDENTIEQLRLWDRAMFNSDRRFYEKLQDTGTYLDSVAGSEAPTEIYTVEDLLNRPLAKLSKAVKVADTGNQGKAESKALSAVTVTLREDTESFKKTDGVFNKDTFS